MVILDNQILQFLRFKYTVWESPPEKKNIKYQLPKKIVIINNEIKQEYMYRNVHKVQT